MASHGITSVTITDGTDSVTLSDLVGARTELSLRQSVSADERTGREEEPGHGRRSEGTVVFLGDSSAADQIETWDDNDTFVTMSASGERSVSWDEDTLVSIEPVPIEGEVQGRSDAYKVTMRFRSGRGEDHNITIS